MQTRKITTGYCVDGYSMVNSRCCNPLHSLHGPRQVQDFSPHSSCFSSHSTSDEAEEQHQEEEVCLINERKKRRMISNRESARRSRLRKQRHLDELRWQVVWLRNENHHLVDKLKHVSENHERAVQENEKLKEETAKLRVMLSDMQLQIPFSAFVEMEDVDCNTNSCDFLC